jgi:hypothetical protein
VRVAAASPRLIKWTRASLQWLIAPGLATVFGFALGCASLLALDALLPHAHDRLTEHGRGSLKQVAAERRSTLLLSALTDPRKPRARSRARRLAGAGGFALVMALDNAFG